MLFEKVGSIEINAASAFQAYAQIRVLQFERFLASISLFLQSFIPKATLKSKAIKPYMTYSAKGLFRPY